MSPRNRPHLALSASDATKLERIWNEHATSVLGMLKSFCACPEDAQDALQELFLRIGKNPSFVESAKSPRAFLIVSARRIAIDAARKRAADQRREESLEATEAVHPAPVSVKNDADLANTISRALAALPSEQRIVFEAKVLHGKTLAVIAAEQSITLNTAASRLRYSLDKIRTQLRPHYETMKNQTTKSHTLSDSSARLIKPLEPKRVPSVVPGLEGFAALAVAEDHTETLDVHEPILCICPAPVEISAPEPVDHAVHVDPVVSEPGTGELPSESVDHARHEDVESEGSHEVVTVGEKVPGDGTDDSSHESTELLTAIFENNLTDEEVSVDHAGESGIDFTDPADPHDPGFQVYQPVLCEFFNFEIQPDQSNGEATEPTDASEISCFDEHDFNEYLLTEYTNFLGEHPEWIDSHSGGDFQAQVVTPSEYTGIDWENPGAAHSFDQWFHATYIAPYEESNTVEEGTLLLAPDYHDHGTLISGDGHQMVADHPAGIPESWWRGGTVELAGGQPIVYKTFAMSGQTGGDMPDLALSGVSVAPVSGVGVVHTQDLNTGHDDSVPALGDASHTIVTGGHVVVAGPVAGSFVVESGGSLSVGDQVFGQGIYNFNAEAAMNTSLHASPAETHAASAKMEAHETAPIGFSVVPIVSGSDSPISTEEVHGMHDGHAATPLANLHTPSPASVELPVLILSQEIQHLDAGSDHETGITFVDDDTYVAPASPDMNAVPVGVPASATHDVAAAMGGAFVAGSATQVAPAAKGLSPRKSLIA